MRSHVNQSTFIQYLFVSPSEEDLDLEKLLANAEDNEALQQAWRAQFAANPKLFFHETYHYWQGLRLPFLYRYAVLTHRTMIRAYQQMSALSRPLTDWDCWLPELYRLAIPARIYWYDDRALGRFAVGLAEGPPADATATAWWDVTPQGLLETAASVSEFQVTSDREIRQNPIAFRRWCKRHPAYLDAFEIVATVLGEELALVAVVPTINAAFETSEPIRGFVEVLAKADGARASGQLDPFLAHPEPRQWVRLVDLILDEVNFESDREDATLLGGPFHRIRLSNWLGATQSGEQVDHPFLTQNAKEWHRRADEDPAYRWLLAQPAWVPEDVLWNALRELGPPLSFLRFRLPGRDRLVTTGSTTFTSPELKRLLTVYSVVLRASEVGFDPRNRLCHHASCPFYEANYCNTYPAVPRDFHDCQFPEIHEEVSRELGK